MCLIPQIAIVNIASDSIVQQRGLLGNQGLDVNRHRCLLPTNDIHQAEHQRHRCSQPPVDGATGEESLEAAGMRALTRTNRLLIQSILAHVSFPFFFIILFSFLGAERQDQTCWQKTPGRLCTENEETRNVQSL